MVHEFIDIEKSLQSDEFKILEWEIILYALYVVTKQAQFEEPTLVRMLKLTKKLIGIDSEDFQRVAVTLAQTYCKNEKYDEFFSFIRQYQLKLTCEPNAKPGWEEQR